MEYDDDDDDRKLYKVCMNAFFIKKKNLIQQNEKRTLEVKKSFLKLIICIST